MAENQKNVNLLLSKSIAMYKKFLFATISCLIISVMVQAQTPKDSIKVTYSSTVNKTPVQPTYYIDSVPVSKKVYTGGIGQDEIASITVAEDSAGGKIYINLKKRIERNFLSLKQVSDKYVKSAVSKFLYTIDGTLFTDEETTLDENYILSIHVVHPESSPFLKENKLAIVQILTRSKENLEKQHQIRIRGAASR